VPPAPNSATCARCPRTGTPAFLREVATRLGSGTNSFGPARANLLSKGLICAPEHGIVAFTVPGMAEFIQRQLEP